MKRRLALAAVLLLPACGTSEIPPPQEAAHRHELERPNRNRLTLDPDPTNADWVGLGRVERARPVRAARTKRPSPVRPAPVRTSKPAGDGPTGNDVWMALARCEAAAGQDSASGRYHGFFQFSLATWQSVGESGDPHTYSYEHQRAAAQRLQARSGWGQWPRCSLRLGLR